MGSIQVALVSQGYVPALKRDGCRNCAKSQPASGGGWYPLECTLGGFGTSPYATCQRYERAADAASRPERAGP